jgi:hypothetical protein
MESKMSNAYSMAAIGLFALFGALIVVQAEVSQKKEDLRNQENTGSYYRLIAIKEMAR